jgi:hypothetical protein
VPKQSDTIEGRLADLIVQHEVFIGDYRVSDDDRLLLVKALRDRARWMAADTKSGEKKKRVVA